MDTTKTYVKIYNISPENAEDFEFDYDTESVEEGCNDILAQIVPYEYDPGKNIWIEIEEYEYNSHDNTMHFTLDTKWEAPTGWVTEASKNVYFQNKLVTMATIQKDETCVTGVAVMDGEVLQNKYIFEMDSEEVGKYYNDEEDSHDLDELDNQIWDSIGKFVKVCEQFYLEREEKND
jgi:hypothetical protein